MSKALFTQARAQILHDTKALRSQPLDELRKFVTAPVTERLQIQHKPMEKTTWAKEHEDSLAVIVEARRKRFLGWSQVATDGFYKSFDGTVTDFHERDYWDHGY
jgi:hypothetical protein